MIERDGQFFKDEYEYRGYLIYQEVKEFCKSCGGRPNLRTSDDIYMGHNYRRYEVFCDNPDCKFKPKTGLHAYRQFSIEVWKYAYAYPKYYSKEFIDFLDKKNKERNKSECTQ